MKKLLISILFIFQSLLFFAQTEIPNNTIDDDSDGLIDCADPDLATLNQCYVCGYNSTAWQTVLPEAGFNKGIAVKYTGLDQHFTIPAGVTSIKVKAWGAGGGGGYVAAYGFGAGAGGFTVDEFITSPGETYVVISGEGGWATRAENQTARSTYGFGGSGNSMASASTSETGSGGGLSGVFLSAATQANARVIAGGGGGMGDADGLDETSGGNGNGPLSGGYLPLTGQNAIANSTGFGGGGGGYVGGISGINRFSFSGHPPNTTADGGEGGSGFKYTTGGLIKFTPELDINPPNMTDVHYITGVGVGNDYDMAMGTLGDIKTGGNGLIVIQWFEPFNDLTISASKDSICRGDTLTLIAHGQSNYLWSPAASLSSDTAKNVIASPTADITYRVISNYNNCKDTAQIQIVVHQLPDLLLSPNSSVCKGDSLQISASGAFTYSWFPVAGLSTSSGTTLTAGPLVTTQYFVTGTDNNNCSVKDSLIITVDSLPIASISGISSICAGDNTTLTASGVGTYLWSTGSTTATIIVAPSSTATYTVIVKNSNNCIDSATLIVVVHPLPIPQFSAGNVCDGSSVAFSNLSTINSPDVIQSFNWNFDDGSLLNTTQSPSHLFASDSSYGVQLLAISNFGCSDSIIKIITVNPEPVINYTANDTAGCTQLCVSFLDLTTVNTGNNATWMWDFGDGSATSNVVNPSHCYTNNAAPVSFSVTLTVTSDSGCVSTLSKNNYILVYPNPTAAFSTASVCFGTAVPFIDLSSIPANTTIQSWAWDFGDGSAVNANQFVPGGHLYTSANNYNVELLIVSDFGCSDSITKIITVNPEPLINFTANDTTGCAQLCVSFQDLTTINTGNNVTRLWDFGDGSATSNAVDPSHCYFNNSSPVSFSVTLTVTSDSGCVSSHSKTNYISVYPNPTAKFSTANVCSGTPVSFTDLSSIPANTIIQSWAWNFGDGSLVHSGQSVPGGHLYAAANDYNVELVIVSNFGCVDSITKPVTVNPKPVVNFSSSNTVGCEPLCISFQNSSSILTGVNLQWAWNVGDGSSVTNSQSFDHCYTNDSVVAPNSFDVTLTVTSDSGCVTTLSKNNYITVYPNPDASFEVQPETTAITNSAISITDLSTGVDHWNWNFGDGSDTSSVNNTTSYTYADTGTYTITLITSTQYSCVDTAYQTISIEPDFVFYIPNAFTPDGDGINDSFSGKGIFIKKYEMTIFDRWGNLIYKTDDIDKPWDGKANRGNEIAQKDVYVYVVKVTDFKNKDHNYKGIVTLVK